jgi:hypothetical protein
MINTSFWKKNNTNCIYHNQTVQCECFFTFPCPESCDVCNRVCRCTWTKTKEDGEGIGRLTCTKEFKKFNNHSIQKVKSTARKEWVFNNITKVEVCTSIVTFDKATKITTYKTFWECKSTLYSVEVNMKKDGSGTYKISNEAKSQSFSPEDPSAIEPVWLLRNSAFDELSKKLERELSDVTEKPL